VLEIKFTYRKARAQTRRPLAHLQRRGVSTKCTLTCKHECFAKQMDPFLQHLIISESDLTPPCRLRVAYTSAHCVQRHVYELVIHRDFLSLWRRCAARVIYFVLQCRLVRARPTRKWAG